MLHNPIVVVKDLEQSFNRLSDINIQLRKDKSELGTQLKARTAEKAALEKEMEKQRILSNNTELELRHKLVSADWFDKIRFYLCTHIFKHTFCGKPEQIKEITQCDYFLRHCGSFHVSHLFQSYYPQVIYHPVFVFHLQTSCLTASAMKRCPIVPISTNTGSTYSSSRDSKPLPSSNINMIRTIK